jgi:hypothetical protein
VPAAAPPPFSHQVSNIVDLGLVSSSEDGHVKIADLDRRKVLHDCQLHRGAVSCFAYSKSFGVVARLGQSVL